MNYAEIVMNPPSGADQQYSTVVWMNNTVQWWGWTIQYSGGDGQYSTVVRTDNTVQWWDGQYSTVVRMDNTVQWCGWTIQWCGWTIQYSGADEQYSCRDGQYSTVGRHQGLALHSLDERPWRDSVPLLPMARAPR